MIQFKNLIEKLNKSPSDFVSDSGSIMFDEYEYQDKDGVNTLVKTGSYNRQDEIESYSKSCSITNILNRFLNGESDLLKQSVGSYGDFRDAPSTYAEYFERVRDAEKIFNALPEEIRDKFDDSPEKFFLEFGTDSFMDKVGYRNSDVDESEDIDNAE